MGKQVQGQRQVELCRTALQTRLTVREGLGGGGPDCGWAELGSAAVSEY